MQCSADRVLVFTTDTSEMPEWAVEVVLVVRVQTKGTKQKRKNFRAQVDAHLRVLYLSFISTARHVS